MSNIPVVNEGDDYKCALCGGVFEAGLSHAEAVAEAVTLFGPEALEDTMEVICDDCWMLVRPGDDLFPITNNPLPYLSTNLLYAPGVSFGWMSDLIKTYDRLKK